MPEITPTEIKATPTIKVVGVGGAGGAVINRMKDVGLKNVQFVAINTDAQALHNSKADVKVHIGKDTTRGLGAGAEPSVGEAAANESMEEIRKALDGADMVFITLGAGGGTGSGAGYLISELAREMGILVVGVATRPFTFEGMKRKANADWAIDRLKGNVDALITIPNDRLLQTIDRRTPLLETFKIADDVLRQGVQGISELITEEGLINLDFADVSKIMRNAGSALMGIGRASGENRAELAAKQAIESPLIEVSIDGARGVLFNVIGGENMSMDEINEVAETIRATVAPDANIIFGANIRPELDDEIIVTVVATGFDSSYGGEGSELKADDDKKSDDKKDEDESPIVAPIKEDIDVDNDVVITPHETTENFVSSEGNSDYLTKETPKEAEPTLFNNENNPPVNEATIDEPAFKRVSSWFKRRNKEDN
ncbi:MAG: cell division protein FtsZ [Candidatus Nomurabacteria bacterium]|jgi:cell division protein FtsZ|nr:cell division protein FtsZ [Candidatus Nomurabacteria bacterium]